MSTQLPDNLSEWPDDPYAVLGVPFGLTPRDIRRAYTQLVRRFKPEQYPDHFRRIREAYETVLRHAEFFGNATPAPVPETPAESPAEQAPQPSTLDRRGPDLFGQMQALWETACAGREIEAYRGLREMHEAHPTCHEICLRLYWVLAIAPEADALKKPVDWLIAGMRSAGMTGPLRELYRRELAEHPGEAVGAAGAEVLLRECAPAQAVDLAEWRFLAAARLGRWELIVADVELLWECLSEAEPESWVRLLLSAMDHLAFVPTPTSRERLEEYRQEAHRHEHLQLRLRAEFDRLDHLFEVANAWHVLSRDSATPRIIVDLVALGWNRPADVRPVVDAFLQWVAHLPEGWLATLSDVHNRGPAALDVVKRLLLTRQAALGERAGSWRKVEDVRPAVAEFLDLQERIMTEGFRINTEGFRRSLLRFCLEEAISPDLIASAVDGMEGYWLTPDKHLSQATADDLPLQCVWLAHRLYWA